jgi:hypothetical protein
MIAERLIYLSRYRLAAALAVLMALAKGGHAEVLGTSASIGADNSLIVDIQVITAGNAARIAVTYQADGVEPLVSRWTALDRDGITKVTIGRLRANRRYTYAVQDTREIGPALRQQ